MTESWNSATGEKEGLVQGLVPVLAGSEMKTFSLPKPVDDDGTNISLKDWQQGLRSSEPTAVYPFKPSKRSTRARFTPVQPWLDEFIKSSPDKFDTAHTTPRTPRTSASQTRSSSVSPPRLDSSCRGDSSLPQVGLSNGDGPNVDEGSVIESPGITLDEARLNDETDISLKGWQLGLRSSEPTAVQPSTFQAGARSREGKDSALPLPEIETAYQSHGMSAGRARGSQLRHSNRQAKRSLDSIGERSKYDSAFDFTSSSSASSYQSQGENTSVSDPDSPSFLLRCNGRRQNDEEEVQDDKVGRILTCPPS